MGIPQSCPLIDECQELLDLAEDVLSGSNDEELIAALEAVKTVKDNLEAIRNINQQLRQCQK